MKLPYRESFAYYTSCMILFNVVYLIRMAMEGLFCPSNINWGNDIYICNFISFCLSGLFLVVGLASTYFICNADDMVKKKNTRGTVVQAFEVHDDTGDNFFSKFSLLVLTGSSIPIMHGIFTLVLFLLVFISLGLVYTDKNLIFINPFLSLMHYNVYHCKCKNNDTGKEEEYYFFKKGAPPNTAKPFTFQKVGKDRKIIRLSKDIVYLNEAKK